MHLAEQNDAAELQDVFIRMFFVGETEGDPDTGSTRLCKHGGERGTVLRRIFLKTGKKRLCGDHSIVPVEKIQQSGRGMLCFVETKCILSETVCRER